MRRNRISLLSLAALVMVTACGDADDGGVAALDDGPAGASAEAPGGADDDTGDQDLDPEEAVLAFAECMREHGVDMPDPQVSEGGGMVFEVSDEGDGSGPEFDPDEMAAAFDECGELIERAAVDRGELVDESELRDQMLEFAHCMRDAGIEIDDPDFSDTDTFEHEARAERGSGAIISGPFGTLDLGDPDVAAAFETCGDTMGIGIAGPIDGGEIVGDDR